MPSLLLTRVQCVSPSLQRMRDKRQPLFCCDAIVLPQVFKSCHAEMPDLAVPEWAADAEEFVTLHRWASTLALA
jgi:hypothetical protein